MSQIYIKEPATNGKVLLKTTLGDIDVELWSKETPLACRNFVQLCLEGYYNGCMFHRVVRDFIAQTGDPTNTGEGGESVYGQSFKDEFHSRLKFNRRGLVGMASSGKDDNTSQFFFTLNRADELNGKHTLFGKVAGSTLYNMIQLNDIPTNKEDRPTDSAPKIIKTEVLSNPFDDIVPRVDRRRLEKMKETPKSQSKATKNFSLLSFGEEAEEDEEEITLASKDKKIKSSHDVLTKDPKLSAQPALNSEELKKENKRKRKAEQTSREDTNDGGRPNEEESDDDDNEFDRQMREQVRKRLRGEVDDEPKLSRTEELRLQSVQLMRELREARRLKDQEEKDTEKQEAELPEVIKEMRKEQALYKSKKKTTKGGLRENQTLEMLSKFKSKLFSARGVFGGGDNEEKATPTSNSERDEVGVAKSDESQATDSPSDKDDALKWLTHRLSFETEEKIVRAKDANVQNEDTFDIYDPRNPLNKRRRGEEGRKKREKHQKEQHRRETGRT